MFIDQYQNAAKSMGASLAHLQIAYRLQSLAGETEAAAHTASLIERAESLVQSFDPLLAEMAESEATRLRLMVGEV